mgnify:FL=1
MSEQEAIEIINNTPFMKMHNMTKNESELYLALQKATEALGNQAELKSYSGEFVYIGNNIIHPCIYSQDADYESSEIIADLN